MTNKLIAALELLGTESGGHAHPMLPGYRGLVKFAGDNQLIGFFFVGISNERPDVGIAPGSTATGVLNFWAPDALPEMVPGLTFELFDGLFKFGTGRVVRYEQI